MWPFRRSQTPPDGPQQHQVTLDLIEQVALVRGQVRSLEIEWGNTRDILQKSYQRMEKANQRAERRLDDSEQDERPPEPSPSEGPKLEHENSFVRKLQQIKGS